MRAATCAVCEGGDCVMTLIEAMKLVRNMAYDFDHAGNVLHELCDNEGTGEEGAFDKQERAIDLVDAWLLEQGSKWPAALSRPFKGGV